MIKFLKIATGNRIPEELAEYMKAEAISNHEKGIIDEDDLPVLLYIYTLLEGIMKIKVQTYSSG